jgi:hypothetical protein
MSLPHRPQLNSTVSIAPKLLGRLPQPHGSEGIVKRRRPGGKSSKENPKSESQNPVQIRTTKKQIRNRSPSGS